MLSIGIVGARTFKDKSAVEEFMISLPKESIIVTSGCRGVCTWVQSKAKENNHETLVYSPDLSNFRSHFDIPKRYYQRNREIVERCDVLHAFISKESGYAGRTRFEIEYAMKIRIPVVIHWEKGTEETFIQSHLSFYQKNNSFSATWQDFFIEAVANERRYI